MNFGRAEIGIVLGACFNLSWVFSFVPWFVFRFADFKIVYSSFCVITIVGLTLLITDRRGFLSRMKGNKLVVALLMILGLILIVQGFVTIFFSGAFLVVGSSPPGAQPTSEQWTIYWLSQVWAGLTSFSGLVWIFYGLLVWGYEEAGFPSLKQEIDLESQTKYPKDLFTKYAALYHNPSGVSYFAKNEGRQNKRASH